ncbi:MAG: glutamate--tRNA ligase [Caldisericia bacterium]
MEKIRVRFAPSPTGLLHIGGVRTAFINYLFARKENGTFILRIEDTDKIRSTEESTNAILFGLKWLNINWDEGPYFQSERTDLYIKYLNYLIKNGYAYPCFCKKEELDREKELALKNGKVYKYSKKCKYLSNREREEKILKGEEFVYRFNVEPGIIKFNDLIKGEVIFDNDVLDDFIIFRQDKTPVYNFSCVVDDIEMKITHVIRGEDHLSNTHKQILIYKALNKEIPYFGHLPLMLGKDREKLSKRHGSVSIEEFKKEGFLPEAILNYLFLIGFSIKDNKEIFTIDEMIKEFSFSRISRSSPVFDHEKLRWLNSYYIRNLSDDDLFDRAYNFIPEDLKNEDKNNLKKILKEIKSNIKVLNDIPNLTTYFYNEPKYNEKDLEAIKDNNKFVKFLKHFLEIIDDIEPFERSLIENNINSILINSGISLKDIAQPLRYLLTGKYVSPGIFVLIELLGKEKIKKRLKSLL